MKEVKIGGSTVGAYVYDADNLRTQKTAGTNVTHYVYGKGGKLYGEYDTSGNMVREYVYLHGAPLAQVDSGEVLSYLHTDHLGTPRYATNTSGVQVWAWASDAFGVGTPTGSATVNLRFAGQYWDDESDLHYNWNRYYDPATGRYITSDPIGLAGGLNTYGYALANPVMYTDPEGKAAILGTIAVATARCLASPLCRKAVAASGLTLYCYVTGICQTAAKNIADACYPPTNANTADEGEESEEDRAKRCATIKQECIAFCSEDLPTSDGSGTDFRKCVRRCMEPSGCSF